MSSLEQFIKAMPKAELHVHLEGTVQPSTLFDLANKYNIRLPVDSEKALLRWYRFSDLRHFLSVLTIVVGCLREPEDFTRITLELGKAAAQQNIRYMEVSICPLPRWRRYGLSFFDLLEAVNKGRNEVAERWGVVIQWIIDHPRDNEPSLAFQSASWAISGRDQGVVAMGLGGVEQDYPPGPYALAFSLARKAGLHSAPHAGETVGPESIWETLRFLNADRIQHGFRAVEDPELIRTLRDQRIGLAISLSSNLQVKAIPSIQVHPICKLFKQGVLVTVNTDDPALFRTTLNKEYLILAQYFGFSYPELEEISLNSIQSSFLPDRQKALMDENFRVEFKRLRLKYSN